MTGRLEQAARYTRTVARLRPAQLAHRLRLRGQRLLLARVPPERLIRVPGADARAPTGWPAAFAPLDLQVRDGSVPDGRRFRFLEESRDLGEPADWEQADASLLWRYHLHYFEWAWALAGIEDRAGARGAFIELWQSWQAATVAGRGVAWSPYVVALRAWALCGVYEALVAGTGTGLEDAWRRSLAFHAAFLRRHLELDVGGNHLVKNLKALVGLGVFLDDDRMVAAASGRLARQVPVQILPDGGHYERSPSYHAQVLGDLIDVDGLLRVAGRPAVGGLADAIEAMRTWLNAMRQPDGDIALFNDCTLVGRARLDLLQPAPASPVRAPVTVLQPSGYAVATAGPFHLVADMGPPCPPDLPAHAHADCLSFELAVDGRRVIVDAGTSTYAPGPRRAWERSTRAHNTVEIDGADQSEVWGTFRAGRLAQPRMEGPLTASHDGYRWLPGQPRHRRTWRVTDTGVEVLDEVTGHGPQAGRAGAGTHTVAARLHIAPGLTVEHADDGAVVAGTLQITVTGPGVTVAIEPVELATGFGRLAAGYAVVARTTAPLPVTLRTAITLTASSPR